MRNKTFLDSTFNASKIGVSFKDYISFKAIILAIPSFQLKLRIKPRKRNSCKVLLGTGFHWMGVNKKYTVAN